MIKRILLFLLMIFTPLLSFGQRSASKDFNITVISSGCLTSPLIQAGATQPASNYFAFPCSPPLPVLLVGSHVWNDLQDEDTTSNPSAVNFTSYVNFLKAHNQTATILWHKDLPTFCSWGAGGTWTIASSTGFPWQRTGPGNASDGLPKFDFTKFNQAYFDRLHARALQLQQNGLFAVVELFDGLGLSVNRCSIDGYPFTGSNNINSINDGYSGGSSGTSSMTGAVPNAMTAIQLAYVKKVIDTVNDLTNVIYEPSEEAPSGSSGWNTYMIAQIQAYEATKPQQHPVLYATTDINSPNDAQLYNSNAMAIAPAAKFSAVNNCSGSGTPTCKVNLQDSDHSYFGMWNDSAQVNRNYAWENFENGANVFFMDPYLIYAGASNPNWTNRNLCDSGVQPAAGVCTVPDPRWNNLRDNLGYMALLFAKLKNPTKMSSSSTLASTSFCLSNNVAVGSEYVVYAPNGGAFTVNLSGQGNRLLNFQWLDPVGGAYSAVTPIIGGNSAQSFTPPWGSARDAVLYIYDSNPVPGFSLGWNRLPNATTVQGNGRDLCPPNNFGGTSYSFDAKCAGAFNAWTSFAFDPTGSNGPRMLSCSNGGHSDYLGNECYEMNPRTNNAFRLNNPSTTFAASCGNADASAPGSGHTYGFNIKSPRLNKIYIWARITGDTSGNGCAAFGMWALDTTTISQSCSPTCAASWAHITPTGLPTSENIVMSSAGADLSSGIIWVWESFNSNGVASFSKFDDVTNTWTRTASLGTNATLYGSLGVDTANQVAVVFSTPNDAPNPGGVFWCDISIGCPSINHPALDSSCNPIAVNGSAGTYDTVNKELVYWPGSGGTVYIVNVVKGSPGSVTCTPETSGTTVGVDIPESFNGGTPMFNKFHYDAPDNVYMLCANINTTCWILKRSPSVILTNNTGSTVTNVPKSVSENFSIGDLPNFPQAKINGSLVATQADVKQRWADGSVRQAIVSFVIPSIAANAKQKVQFINQASGNNTGQLVKADILTAPWNFDMQIQQTGTTNNTLSARTILNSCTSITDPGVDTAGGQNGSCRYWLKGSVVTAVILEDRSATRAFDFKSDANSGSPLHPYFECWFYQQNNNVDCLAGVENTWGSSTQANSMRDQTYAFTLTGGNASPTTLFTQSSFNHIGRSRWVKDYCINGVGTGSLNDCGPAVSIDHNMAYEAFAKAIPNFDPSIIIPSSLTTGNSWVTGDQSIPGTSSGPPDGSGGCGQYGKDMDTGGTSQWFGILNTWEALYWFSQGGTGMYNQVLGNSQVGGCVPFHYREADSSVSGTMFYDASGTISPVGRTVSVNARPMENWGIGSQVSQFNDTCSGSNTRTLNIGAVTDNGWINGGGSAGMDGSHWPEFGYTAALITGKFWYIEEAQMSGAYMVGLDRGCPSGHRNGNMGIIWSTQEGRGTAWMTRAALWAWAVSPDGSPEQTYYFDKLQNNGVYHQGKYGVTNTDSSRVAAYNFGVVQQDDVPNNLLHIYLDGWYGNFVEAPLDTTSSHLLTGTSPWEEQYTVVTFAQARDMGFTNYDSVLKYQAKRMFHLALDPAWGGIYMIGTYRMGSKLVSSGTWLQTSADYTNAFTQGNGSGLSTNWTDQVHSQKPCDYSAEDDHWHAAPLAELALFYPYTVDGLVGRVAYDTARVSLYGSTGCMPDMFNNPGRFTNPSPKWDIFPRR